MDSGPAPEGGGSRNDHHLVSEFQNNDAVKRRVLARGLPSDAREAANLYLKQSSTKYSYMGQNPPQNIFNPLAWADFIQAWKRGDFKNNN